MKQKHIFEIMGYNNDIPEEFIEEIYQNYLRCLRNHKDKDWKETFTLENHSVDWLPESIEFEVDCGTEFKSKNANAYVNGKNKMFLFVDRLKEMSPEKIKATIQHELTHIKQDTKFKNNERNKGEYGYVDAVANGLIDENEYHTYRWLLDRFQEIEIEAMLSQMYHYVYKNNNYQLTNGNNSDLVNKIVDECEEVHNLKWTEEVFDFVQDTINRSLDDLDCYRGTINFIYDAQKSLYGKQMKPINRFEQVKSIGNWLLSIYRKRFERFKHKVYNTVYQALLDKRDNYNQKGNTMKKQVIKLNESDFRKIVKETVKKVLNEGESGGWVVEPFEAEEAYNMFAAELGNEEANAAIVRALGNNALSDVLAYLFRMYDFREWSNREQD